MNMENNWFEVKVKYCKVEENGQEKTTTEICLVDAMSYTEAEARAVKHFQECIIGDFNITSIKKSNISEIVNSNNGSGDKWFKAKIVIIDADQFTGKEKRFNQYFLVACGDVDNALSNLREVLSGYVVPVEIVAISDSRVIQIIEYQDK